MIDTTKLSRLARIRVRLIDDWHRCLHFASMRAALFVGSLIVLLGVASSYWPEAMPFVMRFFPTADKSVGPFVGVVLIAVFRVLKFYFKDDVRNGADY